VRPKNPGGVIVALFFAAVIAFSGFAVGWDDTTRRGIPMWVLGVVGIGCFAAMVIQCWREPRKNLGDGPVMTSGAKKVLGITAVWYLLPILAVVLGFMVSGLR
jgi:phosphate/sulfate permease